MSDKPCDRKSDEPVAADAYLAQIADEIALEDTYRSRSDGLCMHDELNASDSGDGSESAGLRGAAERLLNEVKLHREMGTANEVLGTKQFIDDIETLALAALAPAISRPPTQGASLPPSRADLGGDRTEESKDGQHD